MKRTMLGILTPSSNTVLEPLSSAMVAGLDDVSAHFARFPVTEISLDDASQAQFTMDKQLAAARLLADAQVNAIVWSGTAASWLGFEKDVELCEQITRETGIAAGSSVLAVNELFVRLSARRVAFVTPYIDSIQEQIIANYERAGYECVAERHLGEQRNFHFSNFSETEIADLIRQVASAKPDAITVMCTNMRGARLAEALEKETGIPILDSTSAAVWAGLRIAGADPSRVQGWGRMFALT